VPTFYDSEGVKLTLLSNGVVAITETNHVSYPPECDLPSRNETTTVARTVLEDDDFEQIDAAGIPSSRWRSRRKTSSVATINSVSATKRAATKT
jgi:hypothetical protein